MKAFFIRFWKWLIAIAVGVIAFFVLWRLRKRESELDILRARIDSILQELKEKEAMLKLAQNSKDVEDLKAFIAERKEYVTRLAAQHENERKALQAKIDRIAKAQTWEDLQ